jgi:hypothetical protein
MNVGIKIPDTVLQSMNRYYSNLLAESTDIEKREPLRGTLDAIKENVVGSDSQG